MRGRVRWPLLEPYVLAGPRPAAVAGRLYDTGLDFPAARFDRQGTIHGELVDVRAEALPVLDEIEGTAHSLYGRVVVTTDAGEDAWAYEFGGPVDDLVDLDGRWTGA
jgi:gamma-glutamylcyclotransferase (GGCT)/AIG2-like uncharacterized protein YtfP